MISDAFEVTGICWRRIVVPVTVSRNRTITISSVAPVSDRDITELDIPFEIASSAYTQRCGPLPAM